MSANRAIIIAAVIGAVAGLLAALITALSSGTSNTNTCSSDHGSVTTCANASGYFGTLDRLSQAVNVSSRHGPSVRDRNAGRKR